MKPIQPQARAQMVELREVVQEVVVPVYVEEERTAPPKSFLFARITDEQLLGYGVPEEWIDGVRVATEDSVLDLADHLPAEAAEALLELAVGGTPQPSLLVPADGDPFSHPDALRRFRVMKTSRNWRRPSNTRGIGGPYSCTRTSEGLSTGTTTGLPGYPARQAPARLSSPCTGPAHLARTDTDARVLLTTFSDALANQLRTKVAVLMSDGPEAADKVEVQSLDALGLSLYEARYGTVELATPRIVEELIVEACLSGGNQLRLDLRYVGMRAGHRRLAVVDLGGLPGTCAASAGTGGCPRPSVSCCGRCSSE